MNHVKGIRCSSDFSINMKNMGKNQGDKKTFSTPQIY